MTATKIDNEPADRITRLQEIAISCLKLGSIGFGGNHEVLMIEPLALDHHFIFNSRHHPCDRATLKE